MMRTISLLAVALAMTGCSLSSSLGLAPSPPPVAYTLRAPNPTLPAQRASWQLLVEEPSSVSRFDTQRIALSLGSRLDYYADVAWADRLPVLVQRTLVESFERSGRLQSVAADAAGVRGDLSLKTDLREFQANYPTGNTDIAPEVKVRVAAKLVEPQRREVIASENFEATARAPSARLNDIAAAFDTASQQVLARMVEWTVLQGSRMPSPAPARTGGAAARPRSR
jgi:cholesterol transport system auxiliary component